MVATGQKPKFKTKFKTKKQQRLDGELSLIIDDMARAMWNANRAYIANNPQEYPMTPNMRTAFTKFYDFCARNNAQNA